MRFVLDSNVVIYEIAGLLANPLPEGNYFVSITSKIELLSFAELEPDQELAIEFLLDAITIVALEDDVALGSDPSPETASSQVA